MTMKMIEVGDIVTVYWVDGEQLTEARVVYIEKDTEGMWYLEDSFGKIHAINTKSSAFVELVRIRKRIGG